MQRREKKAEFFFLLKMYFQANSGSFRLVQRNGARAKKRQMSINLSAVDLRVCENKLGPGSLLGSLRDTHIIYTTGVHVFLLIADLKDNIRHGPQRRQECGISVMCLCEVHAAEWIVRKKHTHTKKRDADIRRQRAALTCCCSAKQEGNGMMPEWWMMQFPDGVKDKRHLPHSRLQLH